MPNLLLRKILLSFLTLVLLVISQATLLTSRAYAQDTTWYNQGFTDWYSKVYETENQSEIFGERYTAAQVQWILYSIFAFPINFLGSKVQAATSCVLAAGSSATNLSADISCAQQAIDLISELFNTLKISGFTYNQDPSSVSFVNAYISDYEKRPISGLKYVSTTVKKFFSVPSVNAQNGFGYEAVDGLQKYWKGFRNMAYALSVLVTIIFSFMIMFRVKISPQVVITVQSALPKVFTALILATFSYAIAGFVIELSYVVGGLFASLMYLAGFTNSFNDAWKMIVPIEQTNIFGGFYILFYMLAYTIAFF